MSGWKGNGELQFIRCVTFLGKQIDSSCRLRVHRCADADAFRMVYLFVGLHFYDLKWLELMPPSLELLPSSTVSLERGKSVAYDWDDNVFNDLCAVVASQKKKQTGEQSLLSSVGDSGWVLLNPVPIINAQSLDYQKLKQTDKQRCGSSR